jgi:hypothetical protein
MVPSLQEISGLVTLAKLNQQKSNKITAALYHPGQAQARDYPAELIRVT